MSEAPRIGRYRLVRPLGQGASGAVYEAVAEPDLTPVALKRLLPQALLRDPRAAERLGRELAAARSLDHPGVVRPLDAGEVAGVPYVVYELVAGARPITAAFAGRPLADRVALVREAARALGAAHARGVVHRDVSPGNVLVDAAGRVRVTDFGLALVPGHRTLTRAGEALGTPTTLAPEALLEGSHALTPRADVWALGALLFHALTGAWPYPDVAALERGAREGRPPPGPAELAPGVPAGLDAVCRRALSLRPAERHEDGEALARDLGAAVARTSTGRAAALPFAGAATPDVGARLGRCVLTDRIGAGGMGQVFRGRDEEAGRDVAVKVLPADASDERRRRFLREAQAAARVRHPHVVAVHDAGECGGALYLVMDLVDGQPLDALLAQGALEPRRAVEVVARLCDAVEALHAHGVLHRDLKPGNVLVDASGAPRLTDFGVAALAGAERLTRTHQGVGTPLYMAPEQLDGSGADERVDVYGLGALLYEALTGVQPFNESTSIVHLATLKADGPLPPSRRRPGLDPALDAVCLRALACAPDDRFPSARALGDDLARWLAGERVLATAPRRRRRRALLAAAAALLLAPLGGALLGARTTAPDAMRLAEARRALEASAQGAGRLAELDVEEARALLARAPGADPEAARERTALAAWVGLAHLARGEAPEASATAAAVGSDAALPPRLDPRPGAREGQPGASLPQGDEARRAGLDAPSSRAGGSWPGRARPRARTRSPSCGSSRPPGGAAPSTTRLPPRSRPPRPRRPPAAPRPRPPWRASPPPRRRSAGPWRSSPWRRRSRATSPARRSRRSRGSPRRPARRARASWRWPDASRRGSPPASRTRSGARPRSSPARR
ncbi:MAG: serine/threonine protein kinase [Planctomycetes bacterium]|nr:serine/threonine protein kinase [Planctomycetota bacterium]